MKTATSFFSVLYVVLIMNAGHTTEENFLEYSYPEMQCVNILRCSKFLKNVLCWKTKNGEVGVLTDVKKINAQKQEIMEILPEIGYLCSLQILDLQQNSIKVLPEDLGNLVSLRVLSLHDNLLKNLPQSVFTKLCGLEVLDVSNNLLSYHSKNQGPRTIKIFKEILGPKLRFLNFSGNGLTSGQIDPAIFTLHPNNICIIWPLKEQIEPSREEPRIEPLDDLLTESTASETLEDFFDLKDDQTLLIAL